MIRFRDTIIKGYKICPLTGKIFDEKTGEVQNTWFDQGREVWKRMHVQCLAAHTYLKYFKGCEVHHIDGNKLNNRLSNLQILTKSEHTKLHMKGKKHSPKHISKRITPLIGKKHPAEVCAKISRAQTGKPSNHTGKHHTLETKAKLAEINRGVLNWTNGIENKRSKECPR